jgi:NAD(P)-dependent dehydrogenase (short-subunit alcohol dehydrogenase family)
MPVSSFVLRACARCVCLTDTHFEQPWSVSAEKVGLPADQLKRFQERIVGKSLSKRWGTSDEVARAARFLLSEDSSNITGTELIIDGGVRLNSFSNAPEKGA